MAKKPVAPGSKKELYARVCCRHEPHCLKSRCVYRGVLTIIVFITGSTPLQQFGFDQPNRVIGNFPFSWLSTFVGPIVLFGHLVSIRRLLKKPVEL